MIFSALVGCARLPPTAIGTNAALEPFLILGTLAVPLPDPQPFAEVLLPASGSLPHGCTLAVCAEITALFIKSGLYSSLKIAGSSISSLTSLPLNKRLLS